MAIDFPANPAQGDTHTDNGVEYQFDGTKWKLFSKQYLYKGTALVNLNNQTPIDLTTGNFFDLSLDEQTEIVFVNPPAAGTAQKFSIRLSIGSDYLDTNTEGYDLSLASYDNVSFSVAVQDNNPTGVFFKPDGMMMYVIGRGSNRVHQYTLGTAWDVSTASYGNTTDDSFLVGGQESTPFDVTFRPDGTRMYVIGSNSDRVYQYTLGTAWDISTASYGNDTDDSFFVRSQSSVPSGVFFKPDGLVMYVIGYLSDQVHQYTLSTAWDVSTAAYDSVSFSVSSQESTPLGMTFRPDGNRMYIIGTSDQVHQYTLSTAWDVSTASYGNTTDDSFFIGNQDTSPDDVTFRPDGTQMYIIDSDSDRVHQYTTGLFTTDTVPNITWPTSIVWESGSAPTLPELGETDLLEFYTSDGGTTYYAKLVEDNIS